MKKSLITYNHLLLATVTMLVSCSPHDNDYDGEGITADFSKYIAIGNSLSAGYADNGLYLAGQQVAFPNLIAAQMQQLDNSAAASGFTSPFFREDQANGSGYVRLLGFDEHGIPILDTVTENLAVRGPNPVGPPFLTKYEGPEYHNYGVPGMRLDLSVSLAFAAVNPYFERLQDGTNPLQFSNYFDFTTDRNHSFFSFWLGSNDVLGYALNGGVSTSIDPTNTLTNAGIFNVLYNRYLSSLTSGNRGGVVANIPDVTSIPYFTTITLPIIASVVSERTNGNHNDIFIETSNGVRIATPEDYFFLTFPMQDLGRDTYNNRSMFGLVSDNPIPDTLVLDREEVLEIQERLAQLNAIIKQSAESRGLAFVDVHAFLNQVRSGIRYNGIPISSEFINGGVFSLDGIHLTPLGNAVMANLFIEAINSTYSAGIPRIDVTQYLIVQIPH